MIRRRFNSNKHEVFNYANYMTIEAIDDTVIVFLPRASMYGIDGIGWRQSVGTIEIRKGQMLSVKDNVDSKYGNIAIKGKCNLRGNCMSLVYGDNANEATMMREHSFSSLFANNADIQSVDTTFLPATVLADNCYSFMFYNCTSLTTAPTLPATTLVRYCYDSMFRNCTSLSQVPSILPATTLADYCYEHMFYGCTSLTTAPTLPATKLAIYCYYGMFFYCTSLTTAPTLPATTLVNRCYNDMFYNCSKLKYIKMLATNISASYCLSCWVYNVASRGTFVRHKNMTSLPTGDSGIPSGWSIQSAAQ